MTGREYRAFAASGTQEVRYIRGVLRGGHSGIWNGRKVFAAPAATNVGVLVEDWDRTGSMEK